MVYHALPDLELAAVVSFTCYATLLNLLRLSAYLIMPDGLSCYDQNRTSFLYLLLIA